MQKKRVNKMMAVAVTAAMVLSVAPAYVNAAEDGGDSYSVGFYM